MAIDRQELIDATGGGILEPANGIFSPGQQGYLEDNGLRMEQDLEGAAALIEEYEAETGKQVAFQLGHTPTRANDEAAELLLGWWNEIGVDAQDARRAAGPVHHARAVRRPEVPGLPAGASTPASASTSSTSGGTPPGRTPTASCRSTSGGSTTRRSTRPSTPPARPAIRPRPRAAAEDGQPAVRREVHLHPAVVDAVGHHQRARRAGPRHVHHARRRDWPVTGPGSPARTGRRPCSSRSEVVTMIGWSRRRCARRRDHWS